MKRKNVIRIAGLIILFSLLVTACSSGMKTDLAEPESSNYRSSKGGYSSNADYSYDEDTQGAAVDSGDNGEATSGFREEEQVNKSNIQSQDKIIRTFLLNIETMGFDSLITRIDSEISRLGGYVESSKVSGRRYNDNGARYGSIVARVPSDKVDEFVNIVGENANVVDSQEGSTNVSLDYIDAESRIKALTIEQERLYAILEKEIKLDNIIILESRLSDIRYELQSYESKLRYYDNQVAYSTVTMSIQEVEKLTPVIEIKQSVGTRIKNGFSNTIFNISEGFKNLFVWFVVYLPYLLIWAVIIAVVVIIIRRSLRKSKPDKQFNRPDPTQQNNDRINNQ